jgi:hypothetical protein
MRGRGLAVAMALVTAALGSSPARGQSENKAARAATETASIDQSATIKQATSQHLSGAAAAVKAEVKALVPMTLRERRVYERASSEFPAFCRDWERKLRDREVNNLANIAWRERDGYETATYVGYSPIEQCQCHESRQGIPIGDVTYEEIQYYLVGKTIDEAKHAKPKSIGQTKTLEIFSWERNKWFY